MKRLFRMPIFVIAILFILFVSQGNCFSADKLPVFVSIVPQKYFVQQIGKNLVDVQVMVQPGSSPATYEPTPQQMADLSKAKNYFAIGVPFENVWLEKIAATNPNMRVVHTDHRIEKHAMAAYHHHDCHEEKQHKGGHEPTGLDPHIWLSPPLVKIQARAILAALQEADPEHRSAYGANFKVFSARIDQLDADLKETFTGKKGLGFMVFHPAWGYFARAYGLKQVPIEIEGKAPKPGQLKELIEHAREKGIKVIFVQPQFSTKSAKLIAREIGGQVAFANPLAEDWLANLRQIADKFGAALK
ncbi:MAG: cation ABC transporter substrate-binding protein [Deltaproteobacteria bacterium]|nr:MAG: cation ABC transporter substrate-binding protein [Deltaproteobacteria bacterium]